MLLHVDDRNIASALVTLDPETLARWGPMQSPSATACVHSCDDVLDDRLTRWETIKEFRILDHPIVDDGELTTSQPVTRKVTQSRCQQLLDSMYDAQRHG